MTGTYEAAALQDLSRLGETMMNALSWTPEQGPDWTTFRGLFHPHALLTPAARPSAPISVEMFVQRMTAQRDNGSLKHFQEIQLAQEGHVFGNVATVFQLYRTIVNGGAPGHGISAMVWVRDDSRWSCMAMAWDSAAAGNEIPARWLNSVMLNP